MQPARRFAYLALQAAAAEAPTNRLAPLIDLLYRLPSPRTAAVQQSRRDLLRGWLNEASRGCSLSTS